MSLNSLSYEVQFNKNRITGHLDASLFQGTISENYSYDRSLMDPVAFGSWLITILKSVLYHTQFSEIDLKFTINSRELLSALGPTVQGFAIVIKRTQDLVRKFSQLIVENQEFDACLFYNSDNLNTFEELYQEIKLKNTNSHYLSFFSGWDKKKRTWGKAEGLSLEEMIHFISTKRIKYIFSVNSYYLDHLLQSEHILPLPFFKALGIEWVSIDYDTYEIIPSGYLQRAAQNCLDFRRFSIWPHISSYFDKTYQCTNVRYFMIGDIKTKEEEIFGLESNPDILIASHARIGSILQNLPETLFFLENTSPEDQYLDFQKLYFALIQILTHDSKHAENDKENYFRIFSQIYINALSFLKYDVIESLNDHKIKTQIFGDEAWQFLFPQNYQNQFLNESEMESLFKTKKHLYLLLNQNFSYFENNPVFLRALNFNVPYLCFPSLIKTTDLEGLSKLEYKNRNELIEKLPHINQLIRNPSYLSSRHHLRTKVGECRNDFYSQIINPHSTQEGAFNSQWKQSQTLLDQEITTYIRDNQEKVYQTYYQLLDNRAKLFPINESRFSKYSFCNKIVDSYNQMISVNSMRA